MRLTMLSCLSCCGRARVWREAPAAAAVLVAAQTACRHCARAYLEYANLTQSRLPDLLILIGFLRA